MKIQYSELRTRKLTYRKKRSHALVNFWGLHRNSFTRPITFFSEFFLRYLQINGISLFTEMVLAALIPILKLSLLFLVSALFQLHGLNKVTYWCPHVIYDNLDYLSENQVVTQQELKQIKTYLYELTQKDLSIEQISRYLEFYMSEYLHLEPKKAELVNKLFLQLYYAYPMTNFKSNDSQFKNIYNKELKATFVDSTSKDGYSYLGIDFFDPAKLPTMINVDAKKGGYGILYLFFGLMAQVLALVYAEIPDRANILARANRSYTYAFVTTVCVVYLSVLMSQYEYLSNIINTFTCCPSEINVYTILQTFFEYLKAVISFLVFICLYYTTKDFWNYKEALIFDVLYKSGHISIGLKGRKAFRFQYQRLNFLQKFNTFMAIGLSGPSKYLTLIKNYKAGYTTYGGYSLNVITNVQDTYGFPMIISSLFSLLFAYYVLLEYIINGITKINRFYELLSNSFYSDRSFKARGYNSFFYDLNLVFVIFVAETLKSVPAQLVQYWVDPLNYDFFSFLPSFYVVGPLIYLTLKRYYNMRPLECSGLTYLIHLLIVLNYFVFIPLLREDFSYQDEYRLIYEYKMPFIKPIIFNVSEFKIQSLDSMFRDFIFYFFSDLNYDLLQPNQITPFKKELNVYHLLKLV